jgi:hypothetical protein
MPSRRGFFRSLLGISAGLAFPRIARSHHSYSLRLAESAPIEVPRNFTGLGYEMSSVATPGLLRAWNHRYVNLVRGLGSEGVLRLGGIVANYTRYEPNGEPAFDKHNTVVTDSVLEEFAQFLSAIGWKVIWSVNFAQGTIAQAVEEARAVAAILGRQLLALEIGNEVENYGTNQPFRPHTYNYADYRHEFEQWRAAIAKAVPGVRFAAPDTAQSVDWVERMARDSRGDVQLLTTHYYRNGQKRGSADELLHPDPRLENLVQRIRAASKSSGIPWRVCEMNSFSGGGLPGVSNTFAGALWTLNIMLYLAQAGCAGVNMETGVNQLGFVSSYSPIQGNGAGLNSAGIPYYGMLAFATAFAGCGTICPLDSSIENSSITAYVLGTAGRARSVVVVNMDETKPVQISLADLRLPSSVVLRLEAPQILSSKVTFAGAQIDAAGQWQPATTELVRFEQISVSPMSAAVVLPK